MAAPTAFKLNPRASCFVPRTAVQHAQPASDPSFNARHEHEHEQQEQRIVLLDLPPEIVASIISCLEDVRDVLSSVSACKELLEYTASAPLCLELSCPGPHSNTSSTKPAAWKQGAPSSPATAQLVVSLPKFMPGMVQLNLSGQALEDTDALALLAGLPRLRHLELSSCRKITCHLTTLLLQAASAPGKPLYLQALNLQRCFQLRCSALSELLHASRVGVLSSLQALAMSHLDLTHLTVQPHWTPTAPDTDEGPGDSPARTSLPTAGAAAAAAGDVSYFHSSSLSASASSSFSSSASFAWPSEHLASHRLPRSMGSSTSAAATLGLTVLALNNCSGVSLQSLTALGVLCPQLQYLMLGGCTWLVASPLGPNSNNNFSYAAGGEAAAGSFDSAFGSWSPHNTAAPFLHTADTTASGFALPASALSTAHQEVCCSVARAFPGLKRELQVHGQGWGVRAGTPAAAFTCGSRAPRGIPLAADAPWMADAAAALAAVLLQLPALKAVELTFLPPPVLSRVAAALAMRGAATSVGRGDVTDVPQLWDFTLAASVEQATCALQEAQQQVQLGSALHSHAAQHHTSALRLALRCACNCSNAARATPAHAAAERGDARALRGLLALGAGVDAKERGGAAPVFLAAEAGHVACVASLLEAGANPQIANSAGERPLYIAALRGHLPIVRLLLAHCRTHHIPWESAVLYGDGWTPLMAAAVADHVEVAQLLLRAVEPASAVQLVSATNRYGQCVLHIAARKASARLLRLLLSYCTPCECAACGAKAARDSADVASHDQVAVDCAEHAAQRHSRTSFGRRSLDGKASARTGKAQAPACTSAAGTCRCAYALPNQQKHSAPHLMSPSQRVVTLPDSNGDTPLDVARKNRNSSAVAELTRGLHLLSTAAGASAACACALRASPVHEQHALHSAALPAPASGVDSDWVECV